LYLESSVSSRSKVDNGDYSGKSVEEMKFIEEISEDILREGIKKAIKS
jgi:hypothetical protein